MCVEEIRAMKKGKAGHSKAVVVRVGRDGFSDIGAEI